MRNKFIVLAVNHNPEYLFYLPLTTWAWKRFGWEPIVFHPSPEEFPLVKRVLDHSECYMNWLLPEFEQYNSDTIAQVVRLYAAALPLVHNPLIMTGDVDMIPLSDYWKPDPDKITAYGHDLTGFRHYPICYVAMSLQWWIQIMGISSDVPARLIERDLSYYPQAMKTADPVARWVVDQDLLTDRINATEFEIVKVPRGTLPNGYPVGRVDRSAWTLNHETFIDAHLHRGIWNDPIKLRSTVELLNKVWPENNFDWFELYTQYFKQWMS